MEAGPIKAGLVKAVINRLLIALVRLISLFGSYNSMVNSHIYKRVYRSHEYIDNTTLKVVNRRNKII